MKTYTVRLNGRSIKSFGDEAEAKQFAIHFMTECTSIVKKLGEIDAAVLVSDLSESNIVLKRIMSL